MKFFKKYGVALVLTAAMIVLAVAIGRPSAPKPENPDYYGKWIADDADILSASAEKAISGYNEQLDGKYGSIVGLITVDSWAGEDPEDLTYDRAEEMGFGEWDFVLALSKKDKDFYFAFGASSGDYTNAALETTVIRRMTDDVYTTKASEIIPALYADLTQWYEEYIPEGTGEVASRGENAGAAVFGTLFVFLLILVFIVVVISAASASSRRTTYVHVGTPWYYRPFRRRWYAPPPPPMHFGGGVHRPSSSRPVNSGGGTRPTGFGSTTRSSSRGFGGTSRGGSFGGGPRGGFGGSSRGGRGGFGGRR